jgi:hypothetical protein
VGLGGAGQGLELRIAGMKKGSEAGEGRLGKGGARAGVHCSQWVDWKAIWTVTRAVVGKNRGNGWA